MEIKIREGTIKDYDSLLDLYNELEKLHVDNHPEFFKTPDEPYNDKEYILELINNKEKSLFVAEADGEIVGLAQSVIRESSDFPMLQKRKWVLIDSITVKQGWQSKGIGKLLLDKVTSWTKSNDIDKIQLKVYEFNENAINFYSSKGFKSINREMHLDV